ncbi:plasmid partitioning protein RepB [Shinella sp.]|uniref:plasmid partitioning protein RepB n=1 Tax=Shinella sp. TaxID=1870904 RepID=UPI0029B96617|nr:plasmid partitioning protein RepB [Shinella sp.]MDX3975266.1 plasmid partitioning protein RepB [Shinella sp.]
MTGRDRKNSIKALFGGDILPAGEAAPETKSLPTAGEPGRTSSGAVKAMGLTLSSITREAEEARALRQALEEGERIVALDTDRIEASFVNDRLSDEERDDPDFLALVDSMRDSGQQVPILVRPAAGTDGGGEARYQVAYGHRRLKAARRLGQKVKAIVRALSDEELVLAQGKENAERRNLTFIERALFAQALVARGFERRLVGDALAVQKSELSRLLQVADSVPIRFVREIGPAPKAGRERWMALSAIFENGNGAEIEKATDEVTSEQFRRVSSDERFQKLFDRLAHRAPKAVAAVEEIHRADGGLLAKVERKGKAVRIAFPPDVDPAFIARLTARLEDDYAAFLAARKGEMAGKS